VTRLPEEMAATRLPARVAAIAFLVVVTLATPAPSGRLQTGAGLRLQSGQ
jgi:hypothetical protein